MTAVISTGCAGAVRIVTACVNVPHVLVYQDTYSGLEVLHMRHRLQSHSCRR